MIIEHHLESKKERANPEAHLRKATPIIITMLLPSINTEVVAQALTIVGLILANPEALTLMLTKMLLPHLLPMPIAEPHTMLAVNTNLLIKIDLRVPILIVRMMLQAPPSTPTTSEEEESLMIS